jgi:hypothetical protein
VTRRAGRRGGGPGLFQAEPIPLFGRRAEPKVSRDREEVDQLTIIFPSALPDFEVTIYDVLAEAAQVVLRTTWNGAHRDGFMGIPPTGKRVSLEI